eukprot:CAMPEP_0182532050 /NCGR_PEP_ID=MMETSP1323-20130603/10693_1 /TAXON_ID=236787 /ORGANISM="Florenciella parvula, Strain RCC1693" /LENGTH=113 /DNA_ID=CAMNT_0024741725 /DNA_START=74 /DNA_END=411 /DNA_ORIENTATION=+
MPPKNKKTTQTKTGTIVGRVADGTRAYIKLDGAPGPHNLYIHWREHMSDTSSRTVPPNGTKVQFERRKATDEEKLDDEANKRKIMYPDGKRKVANFKCEQRSVRLLYGGGGGG